MKNKTQKLAIASMISIASMSNAYAGDLSLSVFAGQSKADGFNEICSPIELQTNIQLLIRGSSQRVSCDADDSDSALGLSLNYHFNEMLGVEVGYADLGEYSLTLSGLGQPETVNVSFSAPFVGLVSTFALNDKFSLSLRGGAFKATGDFSSNSINDEIDGDTQGYAGVSLDYAFTNNVSAQLRYDGFDEFGITGLGLVYKFK